MKELERLADFLGVSPNERLKEQILDMCCFEKMKADKMKAVINASDKPPMMARAFKEGFNFFRKGIL